MSKNTSKQKIKSALNHFRLDENKDAISILETDELSENADALLLLGQIYNTTSKSVGGVSRNTSKARKSWLKSFELANIKAAGELAEMYYYGEGVKENYNKAEHYWQAAAVAGDELAQFNLANYYYDDLNEKIDAAIELYKTLIERNEFVGSSYLKLGRIYHRGLGVKQDPKEAYFWLSKGAEIGHGNSCMDLAYMYYRGEGVEKNIDKAISLVEIAGKTEWLKDEALEIAELIRKGTLVH